jgi:hypothetical protein
MTFAVDSIRVVHKDPSQGGFTYFGGVGFDKTVHGDTGIGTSLVPKLVAYINVWAIADLKDWEGNLIAPNRLIHIMVGSRIRNEKLELITSMEEDQSDHSPDMVETQIIIPPQDPEGNYLPMRETTYGFLHVVFEKVSLSDIIPVGIEEELAESPSAYSLHQNFPNPFNLSTTIRYTIPERASGDVLLEIFDVRGNRVITLIEEQANPGAHVAVWDGRNESGQIVSSGIYLYRFHAGGKVQTRRMLMVK